MKNDHMKPNPVKKPIIMKFHLPKLVPRMAIVYPMMNKKTPISKAVLWTVP